MAEKIQLQITVNGVLLGNLIKNNLSCHANKPLTQELIEQITAQIVESVDYFLNKRDENV